MVANTHTNKRGVCVCVQEELYAKFECCSIPVASP